MIPSSIWNLLNFFFLVILNLVDGWRVRKWDVYSILRNRFLILWNPVTNPGDCGKTSFNSKFHTTSCLLRNGQGCPFKERKSFHCSCRDSCKVFNRILFHRKKYRLPLTEAQPVDTTPEPHKKKLKCATFWGVPLSSGTALFSFVFNYETLQTYRKV